MSLLSQYHYPIQPVVNMWFGGHSTLWIVLLSHMLHQVLGLELGHFLADNGMKFVTLMQNQSSEGHVLNKISRQLVKNHHILIRYHPISEKYFGEMHQINWDCQVILFNPKKDDFRQVMGLLSKTKVARSILLLSDAWTTDEEQKMTNVIATHAENSFFYVAVPLDSSRQRSSSWYQIITTSSGYSKSELLFKGNTLRIKENFDMQGLKLRSISLSWPPYLNMEECDGHICTHQFGSLKDYMDILATEFNFTYESLKLVKFETNNYFTISCFFILMQGS